MKTILTTTLVAILAIGLFGISNGGNTIDTAFAQDDTGMMGNDTGMMNATLAFAQNDTGMMGNDTGMMNATLPMSIIGNNGTSN